MSADPIFDEYGQLVLDETGDVVYADPYSGLPMPVGVEDSIDRLTGTFVFQGLTPAWRRSTIVAMLWGVIPFQTWAQVGALGIPFQGPLPGFYRGPH